MAVNNSPRQEAALRDVDTVIAAKQADGTIPWTLRVAPSVLPTDEGKDILRIAEVMNYTDGEANANAVVRGYKMSADSWLPVSMDEALIKTAEANCIETSLIRMAMLEKLGYNVRLRQGLKGHAWFEITLDSGTRLIIDTELKNSIYMQSKDGTQYARVTTVALDAGGMAQTTSNIETRAEKMGYLDLDGNIIYKNGVPWW